MVIFDADWIAKNGEKKCVSENGMISKPQNAHVCSKWWWWSTHFFWVPYFRISPHTTNNQNDLNANRQTSGKSIRSVGIVRESSPVASSILTGGLRHLTGKVAKKGKITCAFARTWCTLNPMVTDWASMPFFGQTHRFSGAKNMSHWRSTVHQKFQRPGYPESFLSLWCHHLVVFFFFRCRLKYWSITHLSEWNLATVTVQYIFVMAGLQPFRSQTVFIVWKAFGKKFSPFNYHARQNNRYSMIYH